MAADLTSKTRRRNPNAVKVSSEDAILPMTDEYMQQINLVYRQTYMVLHQRATLFRDVHLRNRPSSNTNPGDDPLPEDGLGNHEFNTRHEDWDRYDYAYRVKSVRKIGVPLDLKVMKERYGVKNAPRSLVYVPPKMVKDTPLEEQLLVWALDESKDDVDGGSEGNVEEVAMLGKRDRKPKSVTFPTKRQKTVEEV
ncbi:hypothetical protein VNI00_013539 [Paramarasmius palmivorus]|uniref:Uncharacterized protein n=1 Tax=Paramarasmius palmivorus TaxID=297713 RepID=A0AAW0BYG2_9AGAR